MPGEAVFKEIRDILDGNGHIPQDTKDKLIMTALVCVWAELKSVKVTIEESETKQKKWKDHLMMTVTSVLVSFLVVYVLFKVTGFMP